MGLTGTKKPKKKKGCLRFPESDPSETELLKLSDYGDYEESDVASGPEFDIPNIEMLGISFSLNFLKKIGAPLCRQSHF